MSANTEAVFKGFKYSKGYIDVKVEISGKPRAFRFFEPTNEYNGKTVEQQQQSMFNKLAHILEPFGVKKDTLSTMSTELKDLYDNLVKQSKPYLGNTFFLKTIERNGYMALSSWFPFASIAPDMSYHENDIVNVPKEDVGLNEEVDDLPF